MSTKKYKIADDWNRLSWVAFANYVFKVLQDLIHLIPKMFLLTRLIT